MFEAVTIETVLFYCFAAMSLAGAFGVLLSRNIVRTAVWLLSTLAAVAGLYFLMGASFVGTVQLTVYAGGTLVLIVFGVMLTTREGSAFPASRDGTSPMVRFQATRLEVAAGGIVCVVLAGLLVVVFLGTDWRTDRKDGARELDEYKAALVRSGKVSASQVDRFVQADPAISDRLTDIDAKGRDGTANIGQLLLSTYLLPFEAISVLLLAVLIGSAFLARPRVPTAVGGPSSPFREPDETRGQDKGRGGAA